jgi:hypothetical protein
MASITFQPILRDLKDLLKSDFYSIPRFQRPYSWSSENLEDFWRDVVGDNPEGYFIGPMVAYTEGGDVFKIVDGQQRITSITLALCVLRDLFQSIQATRFAAGLQKYIEREDDDSIKHYVLRSEAAGHFLRSQIQAQPPRAPEEPKNDEERALRKAHEEIGSWLRERIEGLSTAHPEEPEQSEVALHLREIRDRILALQIIWIQLDSEDDAYIIFETLNSRGKDLETVDLLKNLLLSAIRAENADLDTARVRWSGMREVLSTAGNGANPNKFILHWWLSRYDYTAERKLFRLIKRRVKKADAPGVLASLHSDAELYARIANPDGWACHKYERPAKTSLAALNMFGVRQPRPLLLALLRAYRDGNLKVGRLKAVLRAVESYHYISTAIVGVSSTGGVSMMYAAHARDISNAKKPKEIHDSVDALVKKLKHGVSSRDTFISEFGNALFYSTERPEAKRLVQYTLRALQDHTMKGVAFDHDRCNIEHLNSQSDPKPWTAEIGNLLWVDEKLNEQLGSKDFKAKQEILESKKSVYDVGDVLSATDWGAEEVAARTLRLAQLAYDKVWRIT